MNFENTLYFEIVKDLSTDLLRYVEGNPGDGYRYSCFVSALPPSWDELVEGGSVDTHYLVTLYEPFKTAYVIKKTGYLALDYVREKFGQDNIGDDRMRSILALIRHATNRQSHSDTDGTNIKYAFGKIPEWRI